VIDSDILAGYCEDLEMEMEMEMEMEKEEEN